MSTTPRLRLVTKEQSTIRSLRTSIHARMIEVVGELSEYYGDDRTCLFREIERVRRGDEGAVGDLSVITWAEAQLCVLKSIEA